MKRVLLINPPMHHREGNIWRGVGSCMPPLGLAYLAAFLERHGGAVSILDAQAWRIATETVHAHVDGARWDVVGITATTSLAESALAIARSIKQRWPHLVVVLGGVHPTVVPEEVLANEHVDYVVRGEGEQTLLELAQGALPEGIAGLSYKQAGAVVHNRDRELFRDLDQLPFPAYHLLPMHRYYPAVGAYRRLPAISVLATRGCPGRCTFCYRIFGQRVRVRSGRNVAEEVMDLARQWGIREISFYDDSFTCRKSNVREFCETLLAQKIDLTWSCFSRVDLVEADLLRLMKTAGCHQISYGVESANAEVLAQIKKRIDLETCERAIRSAKEAGIETRVAMMLGNPGDSAATLEESFRWLLKVEPDIVMFNITTPYPGTEMYRWAKASGCLSTEDWRDYDLSTVVMRLPTVTAEEIQGFYRTAYRRYYGRPGFMWRRLIKMRSFEDLAVNYRGMRSVLTVH